MACVRSFVPKEKNSAGRRELGGQQGGARQLDHRSEGEGHALARLLEYLTGDVVDDRARLLELERA